MKTCQLALADAADAIQIWSKLRSVARSKNNDERKLNPQKENNQKSLHQNLRPK